MLDLLNHAYGFVGAVGPAREHPLAAPQAGLMAALAQGVRLHLPVMFGHFRQLPGAHGDDEEVLKVDAVEGM